MTTGVTETQPRVPAAEPPPPAAPPALATAILLATAPGEDGDAAALLDWEDTTIIGRLADQAASVGAGTIHVITRPQWSEAVEEALEDSAVGRAVMDGGDAAAIRVERSDDPSTDLRAIARVAAEAVGGLLIAQGEVVTQREALAGLAADPRVSTGVLATVGRVGRPFAQRTRSARGRVVSAGSPYHGVHRPTTTFLGVVKVADADRATLADVAERLADLVAPPLREDWQEELRRKMGIWRAVLARAAWREEMDEERPDADLFDDNGATPERELPEDPEQIDLSDDDEAEIARRAKVVPNDVAAMLVTGLVREGVPVAVSHLRRLFWARPVTRAHAERAEREILEHDEDKDLLDSSVKAADGFFTTFFVSTYSKYIARWCARRGFTPNQVTTVSVLIGFAAAAAFATGERWGLIAGAVLLQVAFTTDCVDGQLARYTRQFSKLGAWLDSVFDRTKEYAVFAGLAIGYAASHGDDVWALAGAALALQTVRHMTDFAFGAARQQVIGDAKQPPLEQPRDRMGAAAAAAEEAAAHGAPTAMDPEAEAQLEAAERKPPLPRRILGLWRQLDRAPGAIWVKRMAAFPIGERFAVISITAALWDAKVTFVVLLAWGAFGFAYTFAGRFLRSVSR